MVGRRRYDDDDACAVAHGLDLIGERWALLVVRELLLGPKRFTDLRAGLPGTSPDMLSQRLRELQDAGILRRRKLPPPVGAWVYELTEWGAELEPIVTSLARWSSRSPSKRGDGALGVDSLALSLRALFDPRAARGLDTTVALRLGEHQFRVQIADSGIDVTRDETDGADVTLDTDTGTLAAMLWNGHPLIDAVHARKLRIHGDAATAECFLRLFPLPEQATRSEDHH